RGYAAAGMAAVVEYAQRHVAPVVSLYVNAYNTPALAVYRKVGFHQVGTFATLRFCGGPAGSAPQPRRPPVGRRLPAALAAWAVLERGVTDAHPRRGAG